MTTTLYGINNCDTIKKVRRWLTNKQIAYEFHDYKKLGCGQDLARELIRQFELDALINKRGTTWRRLDEQVKAQLNEQTAAGLMTDNPSLIKRPILCIDGQWLLGFDEDRWQSLLTK